MNRYLRISLLICGLALVSSQIRAQDEKYDACYLSLTREYTLNVDGSMDYRYTKQLELISSRAFQSLYGETFILYTPLVQKLKINSVFTVMADGKKVEAPANAFNEVLTSAAANAPAYNGLREMVVTHTGLERKAVIHLDYTIHTEKGYFPALAGNDMLAEAEPVKSLVTRVRIPAGRELFYRMFNGDAQPVITTEGAFRVYTWKLENIPATVSEEAQQGLNERYPRLIFSTSEKRDEAYAFLTNQPAFRFACADQMKNAVNEWLKEKKEKFEKVLLLQEKVVSDFRLYPIPLKSSLYQCRTPEETWNENGGTPVEKAVLLVSLLKYAGIDAQVAAVTRTAWANDKIGTLADIEDFVVKTEFKDKGTWYFSVSALNGTNLKFTLPGRSFTALAPGGKVSVTKAEPVRHMVKVIGNFIVTSDPRLTGDVSLYFEGGIYPFAGLAREKSRMKNALTGNLIGADSANLKVSTMNQENGFQTYIVQSDKPFRKDSNYYYFNLPVVSTGIDGWGIRTLSQKRETPYEIPAQADESYAFTLALPPGLNCFTPARKVAVSNKAGRFLWEVVNEKGKLSLRRQLQFNDRVFDAALYPDFKILMDYWNNPWYRQLVFVKE